MARTNFKETQKLVELFSEKKKPEKAQLTAPSAQLIAQQRADMQRQQQMQQQMQQQGGGVHATPQGRAQTMPASAFKNAQQMQQYQQHMQQQQQQQYQLQRASVATSPAPESKAPASRTGLDKVSGCACMTGWPSAAVWSAHADLRWMLLYAVSACRTDS